MNKIIDNLDQKRNDIGVPKLVLSHNAPQIKNHRQNQYYNHNEKKKVELLTNLVQSLDEVFFFHQINRKPTLKG